MSYCVNCGVKLKKSEKKCPLCDTLVINPNKIEDFTPVYSPEIEEFKRIDKKFISELIITILLVLSVIVVLCNLITSNEISWSIYVIISSLLISSQLLLLHKNIYVALVCELISIELFMLAIAALNNGINWYLYLVMPFIFIIWSYIILCIYLLRRKESNVLKRFSISFAFSSIALLVIETCIDLYKYNEVNYNWSIYGVLPILIISIIMFIISCNKKLMEEIKQRMFI